jgi:hypothetical protein
MRRTSNGQQLVGDNNGRVVLLAVDGALPPLTEIVLHAAMLP